MIIDNIKNLAQYNIVSDKVLEFLTSLNENSEVGHYEIDENSYANIDEYETKLFNVCKFEAHKKFIDIQMILSGVEQLDYISVNGLEVTQSYDTNRDVMFFKNPNNQPDTVILEPFKFAFIHPYEAHKPQMSISNKPQKVKKVVVKIKVNR